MFNMSAQELEIAMKFKGVIELLADFFIEHPQDFQNLTEYAKKTGRTTEMAIIIKLVHARLEELKEKEGGDAG